MNRKNNKIGLLLLATFFVAAVNVLAQDSTKKELVVTVGYYMTNNTVMYLLVNTKTKIDKKFQPVANSAITLYLDSVAENNLVGKVKTDKNGLAKAIIPPALKTAWESSADHKFLAESEGTKEFDETTAEGVVTKSKIAIDTSSDAETKNITVTVSALKNGEWVPAKEVEMKVGIHRLDGSILSAGDEATYTTDSTGSVTVELKRTNMPGDEKGNIILAAKVEENEQYGNLLFEKTVPWGAAVKRDNSFFDQRTLWSTRFRTPFWLLFMAYSIVLGVWGTLIYLVIQLIKIKKLAKSSSV